VDYVEFPYMLCEFERSKGTWPVSTSIGDSERVEGFVLHSSSTLLPALCKNAEIESAATVNVAQGFVLGASE
jgi:hypothetical protein